MRIPTKPLVATAVLMSVLHSGAGAQAPSSTWYEVSPFSCTQLEMHVNVHQAPAWYHPETVSLTLHILDPDGIIIHAVKMEPDWLEEIGDHWSAPKSWAEIVGAKSTGYYEIVTVYWVEARTTGMGTEYMRLFQILTHTDYRVYCEFGGPGPGPEPEPTLTQIFLPLVLR